MLGVCRAYFYVAIPGYAGGKLDKLSGKRGHERGIDPIRFDWKLKGARAEALASATARATLATTKRE